MMSHLSGGSQSLISLDVSQYQTEAPKEYKLTLARRSILGTVEDLAYKHDAIIQAQVEEL